MIRKTIILVLVIALGLSAELWVNAIRDPGAELGAGDWDTDIWEKPGLEGSADSARVNAHDSARAYEGNYSFLTDTRKNPHIGPAECHVFCYQPLCVPKAVADIDSCFWVVYVEYFIELRLCEFSYAFRSQAGKTIRWTSGNPTYPPDTIYTTKFALPERGVWTEYGADLYNKWVSAAGWSALDTITEVQLHSWGVEAWDWYGQEVSWDNVRLRSIAYYDYAAKTIDSEEHVDQSYTPIATFANEGIKDDSSAMVYAEILDGEAVVYKDSQEVSIPAESLEQVVFREWTVPHGGSYILRVYPILGLDEYSADDTLEQTLGGIEEGSEDVEFVTTRYTPSGILFSFAPGVSGNLSIYDASGREVCNQLIQPGTRELLWATKGIPSGLYFYKIKTPTLRLTDKLLILH
jgi:hypothetical protein